MRLIDADALPRHGQRGGLVHWQDIENAPTIDAVPKQHLVNWAYVTRCKDCVYSHEKINDDNEWTVVCDIWNDTTADYGFCSYGERKDNETD